MCRHVVREIDQLHLPAQTVGTVPRAGDMRGLSRAGATHGSERMASHDVPLVRPRVVFSASLVAVAALVRIHATYGGWKNCVSAEGGPRAVI